MDAVPTAALATFAEALADADDVGRLVLVLATHSRALLKVSAVSVLLAGPDGALVAGGMPNQPKFAPLFDPQLGPAIDCYRSGRCVAVTVGGAHSLGWPKLATVMSEVGVAVADAVPLGVRGRTVGALTAFRADINPGASERHLGGLVRGMANLSVGNLASPV